MLALPKCWAGLNGHSMLADNHCALTALQRCLLKPWLRRMTWTPLWMQWSWNPKMMIWRQWVLSLQSSRTQAWPSALPVSLPLRWMRRLVRRGMEKHMLPSMGAEKGWKPVQPVRPISSHLISSHLISSHLISSHLNSTQLTPPHPTLPHCLLCRFISSHLISSHLISSHLFPSLVLAQSDDNVRSRLVCCEAYACSAVCMT